MIQPASPVVSMQVRDLDLVNLPAAIAPGVYVPDDEFGDFLESLDNDPTALAEYISLVTCSKVALTHENIDPLLWEAYAPIFDHLNWQRRLSRHEPKAMEIHLACQVWRQTYGLSPIRAQNRPYPGARS